MTRDQMHNTLRYVREQLAEERGSDFSGVKALDLVLEELEQEPSGDLISRQAVVNAIKYAQVNFTINSTINFANYTKEVQAIVDNILSAQIKAVNELQSVNPQEPKTGHWIKQSENVNRCSECELMVLKTNINNYCPNCGAKMVEPQESEG